MTGILFQIARSDVTQMLRADALHLLLGSFLVTAGLAAFFAHGRLRTRAEPSLLWFSVFAFLYGVRLLARTTAFPLLVGPRSTAWLYLASAITYAIPIPVLLFLRVAFPRWRRALSWAIAAMALFALGAIGADALLATPYSAVAPNNLIAIAFIGLSLFMAFRPTARPGDELRTLRLGLLAAAATALFDNLRGLGVVSWPRFELEPAGTTVLIVCLGAVATRRVVEGGRRLLVIEKELSIARRIQASILPATMPSVTGLTVAARYQPMTDVAGDLYEFLPAGEGQLGILVADVSGHGVPAALIASMVKIAAVAQAGSSAHPAAVLTAMNRTLTGQLGGQYVTAAYVFLDRPAGRMRYAAAGHPPLLHRAAGSAAVSEIEENGLPLGLMEHVEYSEREQPLQVGDRFVLYTDGVVEASDRAGDFFGLERLKECARSKGAADAVADDVVTQTKAWTQGVPSDDVTLVVVDCV